MDAWKTDTDECQQIQSIVVVVRIDGENCLKVSMLLLLSAQNKIWACFWLVWDEASNDQYRLLLVSFSKSVRLNKDPNESSYTSQTIMNP